VFQPLLILPHIRAYHLSLLVVPCAYSVPVHLAILPLTLVSVEPSRACAIAAYGVLLDIALVKCVVGVLELARAVFQTV